MLVLLQTVYTICLWLNAIRSLSGMDRGLYPRELVTGRGVDYNKDCRANLGRYIQSSTDKVFTNDNTPRTHGCIALVPSGNRQGSLKSFDLDTGKLVVRRIAKQIPWPDRILKIASEWGRKSKKLVMGDSIQFLNRKGKNLTGTRTNCQTWRSIRTQSKRFTPIFRQSCPGLTSNETYILRRE